MAHFIQYWRMKMTTKMELATLTFEEILVTQIGVRVPVGTDLYELGKTMYKDREVVLNDEDLQVTNLMVETDTELLDWKEI